MLRGGCVEEDAMEALAATVTSLVAPYLAKGAEEFAKEAGREAFDKVRDLVNRLQVWWTGDAVAGALVGDLQTNPVEGSKMLGERLAFAMSRDSSLAAEVKQLVFGCPSSGFLGQRARQNKGGSGASVW
jgi:hypothetical protein